jgi:hypothetical protein
MSSLSAPVKPRLLGVLGEKAEIEDDGLPYVIETAFGYRDSEDEGVFLHEGFNFTPAIGGSPFRLNELLGQAPI